VRIAETHGLRAIRNDEASRELLARTLERAPPQAA
jgi:hypothetical protein